MNKYAIAILKLTKLAFTLSETQFKPIDNSNIGLFVKNKKTGADVQFGVMNIEQDFVDFLLSKQFDNRVDGIDGIVNYIKSRSLAPIPDDKNIEASTIIDRNFNIAKDGDESAILELAKNKSDQTPIRAAFKRKETGDQKHDAALQYFRYHLQNASSGPK